MLKQLWVRLTLAFVAVTLIAVLTVAMFADTQAGQSFQQYLNRRDVLAQSGYLDELAAYYQRTGSWAGVESVFGSLNPGTPGRGRGAQGGQGSGQGRMGGRPTIMLADSERRIVYDERGGRAATSISDDELAYTLPVNVDGKTVGYLAVVPGRGTGLQPPEENFLTQLRETLLLAALVAGLVGIALGLIISRTLAAPLARLSQAARALAARDWSRRVEVQGAAEIAEVGKAFNAMADELQRAETLRRNLVAEIAHELRTPLTVMQGNLRAILDGVYPLERHEIATLYDETRLLSRLVNDLHELALADAGQLPLNMQAIDIVGALNAAVSKFEIAAEAQGLGVILEAAPNLPPVQADADRLAQVLQNLLANALRHTPAGNITLATTADGVTGRVCISVADSGEGIPPEELPHVFDRFFRGDSLRAHARSGSGLGLAIARSWVIAMNGEIGVESIQGQGSRFWFTLNIAGGGRSGPVQS